LGLRIGRWCWKWIIGWCCKV